MFLALREIRRAKARFALLAGAVGLLVVLLLFFQSVANALTGALTGAIANQSGEVIVYDIRARQNPAASVLPAAGLGAVAQVDGVADSAGIRQLFVSVTMGSGEEIDAVLLGFRPRGPGTPVHLSDGRLPENAGQALVSGSSFDPVYPVGTQATVARAEVDLEIVGIADGAAANAVTALYVTDETFERVVAASSGTASPSPANGGGALPLSWIAVSPDDGVEPAVLAARITEQVDGVEALERAAAVAALPGVDQISQSFGILYLLLFVVVSVVTGVFFLILTVQKRGALVLLRAVGAERRDVVLPVLLQVILVVGVGAVVGSLVTAGLLLGARDVFGGRLDPGAAATASAAILVLGLVSATAAVRRVLAIEPAEATMSGGLE